MNTRPGDGFARSQGKIRRSTQSLQAPCTTFQTIVVKDNSVNDSNSTLVKFCKKCQCETARYKCGKCRPCNVQYNLAWRRLTAKRLIDPNDKRTSKEKRSDRDAARHKLDKAKNNAKSRDWYEANKEKHSNLTKAWRLANPNAYRIQRQNRKARKSQFKLSLGLSEKLFLIQRGMCACCGQPLGDKYHLDHIMPLALGGTNTDDNIQLLRQRCNNQKHAKHPVDFMQSRGFLL